MTDSPHAHFTVFVTPDGYHEAGWRVSEQNPRESVSIENYARIARTCERGLLDAVFMADRPALSKLRAEFFPQVWWDPFVWLPVLGARTERIGLIGTATTTYSAPYDLARRLATADHATAGRIGWNVVSTHDGSAAQNFGLPEHPGHEDRYARAGEFVDVVLRLWDGWDDGAIVADKASGIWADPARIREAGFHGDRYDVAGALPVPRSPQGHPVLAQAGSSPSGIDLAARIADLVFTPQASIEAGLQFRATMTEAASRHGRRGDAIKILPGIAYVLASTEAEAADRRTELEESVNVTFRAKNLAYNAGIDPDLIDPDRPLTPELAATGGDSTFARTIIERALESKLPFGELARTITGLPGGLEFTGTPEQLTDLVEEWVTRGASDGFTLQPARIPADLDLFVDEVVPLLQRRGLHRNEYTGVTLQDHLGLARPSVVSGRG